MSQPPVHAKTPPDGLLKSRR
uniref:Uncharacterized protein n=1 Tax=Anguilla anguilla TaxID=7936 RepID=A0A0E9UJP9_ANGAN